METAEFKYTKSQQVAYDKLTAFMQSSERMFILTGKAGTGKTTLIGHVLEGLLDKDRDKLKKTKKDDIATPNVLGVAMAHKAKNNLQEKGGIPYVNTFASAYGHREKFMDDGKRVFVPIKEKLQYADCRKPISVFVFDEVSMFSANMLKLVLQETTMFAKLIFMGDRGQLPPIIEGRDVDRDIDSPVFDLAIPDDCRHELTERVRQTLGNPIIDLSDIIYELIFEDPDWADMKALLKIVGQDTLNEFGKGYQRATYGNVYEKFSASSDNYLDTKVIAYRRNAVADFNKNLRNFIHDHPQEIFIPNEIIYMNKTFYGEDVQGENFAFYNASEYIIEDTSYGEIDGIPVMYAFLEGTKSMPVVDGHDAKELFKFRVAEYRNKKDWLGMYGFMDSFGDFNYGYALTAYKAQGSTYKTVFVDVNDIVTLEVLSVKRRLQSLYTAITRASDNVYFIGR